MCWIDAKSRYQMYFISVICVCWGGMHVIMVCQRLWNISAGYCKVTLSDISFFSRFSTNTFFVLSFVWVKEICIQLWYNFDLKFWYNWGCRNILLTVICLRFYWCLMQLLWGNYRIAPSCSCLGKASQKSREECKHNVGRVTGSSKKYVNFDISMKLSVSSFNCTT